MATARTFESQASSRPAAVLCPFRAATGALLHVLRTCTGIVRPAALPGKVDSSEVAASGSQSSAAGSAAGSTVPLSQLIKLLRDQTSKVESKRGLRPISTDISSVALSAGVPFFGWQREAHGKWHAPG